MRVRHGCWRGLNINIAFAFTHKYGAGKNRSAVAHKENAVINREQNRNKPIFHVLTSISLPLSPPPPSPWT